MRSSALTNRMTDVNQHAQSGAVEVRSVSGKRLPARAVIQSKQKASAASGWDVLSGSWRGQPQRSTAAWCTLRAFAEASQCALRLREVSVSAASVSASSAQEQADAREHAPEVSGAGVPGDTPAGTADPLSSTLAQMHQAENALWCLVRPCAEKWRRLRPEASAALSPTRTPCPLPRRAPRLPLRASMFAPRALGSAVLPRKRQERGDGGGVRLPQANAPQRTEDASKVREAERDEKKETESLQADDDSEGCQETVLDVRCSDGVLFGQEWKADDESSGATTRFHSVCLPVCLSVCLCVCPSVRLSLDTRMIHTHMHALAYSSVFRHTRDIYTHACPCILGCAHPARDRLVWTYVGVKGGEGGPAELVARGSRATTRFRM